VNDIFPPFDDDRQREQPRRRDERQFEFAHLNSAELNPIREYPRDRSYAHATIAIILVFWVIQYIGTSLLVWAMTPGSDGSRLYMLYMPRLFVTLGGVAISFAMVTIQSRLQDFGLAGRGIIAAIMAFVGPALSMMINFVIFYYVFGFSKSGQPTALDLLQDYLVRLWYFGSLSGIILALSYAADIREREARIHSLEGLAHSAQLRALRNQLNPHFLFNALNSIAGLMRVKRPQDAETMTENLADFLRTTLALDPQAMITLDEELRLQDLYLAIEKVRFPDRLRVEVSVPKELESALVPSLLTQPLIENTIKYAVARSTGAVHLRIDAKRLGECLLLTIEDDGGNATPMSANSSRLGLRNIAERLQVHFGAHASLVAGPRPKGGFRSRLSLPLALG